MHNQQNEGNAGLTGIALIQTVDKPFWQSFDMHGGTVRGDGNPPSRYILAKSEYNSDFASYKLSTKCRQLV